MHGSYRLGRLGSGRLAAACLLAVFTCFGGVAPAAATDLTLRAQGQITSSDADALGLGDDFGTSVGGYVGLEVPLNERLGLEFGVGWMEFEQSTDVDFLFLSFETEASLTMTPVTVALDVHLTPNSRYDLYLAPKIGWAFFDDLEVRTDLTTDDFGFPVIPGVPVVPTFPIQPPLPAVDVAVEDQFVYGLRVGFDVPFGDSAWSFASSVEILSVDLEIEAASGAEFGLDPVSVGLGVGYRF